MTHRLARRLAGLGFLTIALVGGTAASAAEPTSPLVIAHRGASGHLPEHTLAGYALAHAQGADFIEQDVVLSRDGVPVVLHDLVLEPVTDVAERFPDRARADGRWYAADFTLAEMRTLRVGARLRADGSPRRPGRFPPGSRPFGIPTLAEALATVQGLNATLGRVAGVYVEVKDPAWHRVEGLDVAQAVVAALHTAGYRDKADPAIVQCFDWAETRRIRRELGWRGRLVQLLGEPAWDIAPGTDFAHLQTAAGLAEVAGVADGVGPWIGQLAAAGGDRPVATGLTGRARAVGLAIHAYTLREDVLPDWADSLESAVEVLLGDVLLPGGLADGVFTDHPGPVGRALTGL